ncbi:ubiquinone biosynthesis accessory factor UbiJ [Snodgrassella communis]|uniref:ubiquinone biosynthesis accessory factor UbiJ n=1 Tax=Snodgrassella communis TaxID=2946699 RepID=UPI001EF544F8|nr:SCP2 domain-containing protein [Snodgrassella communis]
MLTLALLNHLIQQNVELKTRWQQHQQRVIALVLPMLTLKGRIDAQGFWQEDCAEADTTITIASSALSKMLSGIQPGVGDVHISGDHALGMAILPLIQALQYDWRNDLTRLLGDTVGGKVAQELENLYQHGRAISHSIAAQVADYARESDAAVVGQQQLQQFTAQVETLRDDSARLAARIARLQQKLN